MSLEVVSMDVLTVNPWAPELVDRGDGMQEPGEVAATIRLRRLPSSVGGADRDRLAWRSHQAVPCLRSNAIEVLPHAHPCAMNIWTAVDRVEIKPGTDCDAPVGSRATILWDRDTG